MGCGPDPTPDGLERAGSDPTGTTAAAVIPDGAIVLGDGGARGVKGDSAAVSDGAGALSGLVTVAVGDGAVGACAVQVGQASNGLIRSTTNVLGIVAGGNWQLRANGATAVIDCYSTFQPSANNGEILGADATRWKTTHTGGIAASYVNTAAASYTATAADRIIVATAATAAIVLPAGVNGTDFLVKFTGATSRTMTPNGAETVDTASPTQNIWYWCHYDVTNTNWVMIAQ